MTAGTIICDVTDPDEGHGAAVFASALGTRLGMRIVFAVVRGERDRKRPLRAIADDVDDGTEIRLTSGERADALARLAAEEGADLIIIGSRAVGLGGRNLRCTLARELEAATPVPILVAPPPTRRRSRRRLDTAAYADTR